MAKDIKIKLRNANQIFPNKYTKLRYEDFTGLIVDKSDYLSHEEKSKIQNIADMMESSGNFEYMAIRQGNKIILRKI